MLTLIFFLFCLFSQVISSVSTSTPRYTTADNIAINCATRDNSTAMDKCQWVGDIHSKFTPIKEGDHKSNASTPQIQDSSVNTVPYKTARLSYSQFMHEFHVTPGPKFVRFYFYPVSYSGFEGSHHDLFTVKANSFTLLSNFSAFDVGRFLPSGIPFDPGITFDPSILGKQFFLSRVAKPGEETREHEFHLDYCSPGHVLFTGISVYLGTSPG